MHVQYVVLCDQVIMGADGRPSLINILSEVRVAAVPVTLPRLSVAARILLTADELHRNLKVEVVISDPSGTELGRPGGEMTLPTVPPGIDSLAVDLPLQLDFFELTSSGRYTFLLHVNGAPTAAAQLTLRVGQ